MTHVTEVVGMEGEIITLQDVFRFRSLTWLRRARPFSWRPEVHRPSAHVPGQARCTRHLRRLLTLCLRDLPSVISRLRSRPTQARLLGLVAGFLGLSLLVTGPAFAATGELAEIGAQESTFPWSCERGNSPGRQHRPRERAAQYRRGVGRRGSGALGEAAIEPAQRIVLTIDTSGSLEGLRRQAAKDAAIAFLAAGPADAEVGLVLFNDAVAKVVPPSTDRAAVRTEVDAAVADGDTALYDAVIAGLDLLGEQGLRTFVLLSDGANDTTSPTTSIRPPSVAPRHRPVTGPTS